MTSIKTRVTIDDITLMLGEAMVKWPVLPPGGGGQKWITIGDPAPVAGDKVTIWHERGFEQHFRVGRNNQLMVKIRSVGQNFSEDGINKLLKLIENAEPDDKAQWNPPVRNRIVVIDASSGWLLPAPQEHDLSGQEIL